MHAQHLESFQLIQNGMPKDCGNALIDCGTCMCVIVTNVAGNFKHFVCGSDIWQIMVAVTLSQLWDLGNNNPGYPYSWKEFLIWSSLFLEC